MKNYSEKLRDPRWQKKRLEVFNRDSFSCTLCGCSTVELQVHHLKYYRNPWDVEIEHLKTLCKLCHEFSEAIKDQPLSVVSAEFSEDARFYVMSDSSIVFKSVYEGDFSGWDIHFKHRSQNLKKLYEMAFNIVENG